LCFVLSNRDWNRFLTAVKIVLNGQPRELPATLTVAELLVALEMPTRGVAVEVNQQIVPRAEHAVHRLRDGDQLEVVSLVGGG
jgi:sulfur carrier protein